MTERITVLVVMKNSTVCLKYLSVQKHRHCYRTYLMCRIYINSLHLLCTRTCIIKKKYGTCLYEWLQFHDFIIFCSDYKRILIYVYCHICISNKYNVRPWHVLRPWLSPRKDLGSINNLFY